MQLTAKRVSLAEMVGTKTEGSQTVEVGEYKITTRATVKRTVIEDQLGQALTAIDPRWLDVVKVKHSVNKKRLDQMQQEDRDAWLKMSRAIEAKSQAIGVTVRRVEVTA
tara:strand:- start:430 stop:756 length:327 start_codon:yes stop_codon:yes gene_type:complete